jgi:hypothetical protein
VTGFARRLGLALFLAILLLGALKAPGLLRITAPDRQRTLPCPPEAPGPPVVAVPAPPSAADPPRSSEPLLLVPTEALTLTRPSRTPRLPGQPDLSRILEIEAAIKKYARAHGVAKDLVRAIIRQESNFNPTAVSPKGALGLMQLMPGTAASLGVTEPFDVEQNIVGGIKYLESCLKRFNGDVSLALAAYNAGPDNVIKYQGCPPFPETQHYVAAVLQGYSGASAPRMGGPGLSGGTPSRESAGPPPDDGLAWNLPTPVVKVHRPQWHISQPRWKVITFADRVKTMTARATVAKRTPDQME